MYTSDFVISKDGTRIAYRQLGTGPGLILVHGGMQAAQNFMQLGILLSDRFTVYIPDRRGRGQSEPPGEGYGLAKECEDIEALLLKTNAHFIFGLSSGAIITLEAARLLPAIHKAAIYEPPLRCHDLWPDPWAKRYLEEIKEGKLAEAMVTVLKGTGDRWSFTMLPRFILQPLIRMAIKAEAAKGQGEDIPIRDLIPTLRYDCMLVEETEGRFEKYKEIKTKLLLIGGTRSMTTLRNILAALYALLPSSRFMQLPGVGHVAADNIGRPELVAEQLKLFFEEDDDLSFVLDLIFSML